MDFLLTFLVGAWGGVAGAWVYLEYRAWRHRQMVARVMQSILEDEAKRGAP